MSKAMQLKAKILNSRRRRRKNGVKKVLCLARLYCFAPFLLQWRIFLNQFDLA